MRAALIAFAFVGLFVLVRISVWYWRPAPPQVEVGFGAGGWGQAPLKRVPLPAGGVTPTTLPCPGCASLETKLD